MTHTDFRTLEGIYKNLHDFRYEHCQVETSRVSPEFYEKLSDFTFEVADYLGKAEFTQEQRV